jgi:hypothetical protein
VRQSPLVTIPPARVYDSRPGQAPTLIGPKTPITNGSTVLVAVSANASGVPTGASAVLGNITVTGTAAPVFLTVYADGATQPGTSNINAFGAGQTIANSFTSQIASDSIAITCGGGPTDFIIDIFGYYP